MTLQARLYSPRLYGEPTVNPGLKDYVRKWFGADCPTPFEVDLTQGAVGTIERVLGSYLVAGDKVAVENPCFLSSINLLRTAGLQPLGVSVDAEGMCPDALEAALAKGASAVILTLRAHNLTGYSMSEKRARVLMRLLAKHPHLLLIVDDHFALLSNTAYYSVASAARVACT
ncbi:aminotransferase class I/II-fold pyridoxal phosphate-dependent enzyme [Acidovorax sp. SDU_ACID1]|uniref:aminotransferase class I/II-fold pyridoxal phosphate-dependent enzyme n=1 Tax=Acidovorax sp. SDU_ACID1 TaxID=3136632 RepID=UPI003872CA65